MALVYDRPHAPPRQQAQPARPDARRAPQRGARAGRPLFLQPTTVPAPSGQQPVKAGDGELPAKGAPILEEKAAAESPETPQPEQQPQAVVARLRAPTTGEDQRTSTDPGEQAIEPSAEAPDEQPVLIPWPPVKLALSIDWTAPDGLASDTLTFPPRNPKEQATPTGPTPDEARAQAQRAYSDIASYSRRAQGEFGETVERSIGEMLQVFTDSSDHITQVNDRSLEDLTLVGRQAEDAVDTAADGADADLEALYQKTRLQLHMAAGRAYGAVNANYDAAGGQITSLLTSLVAGHTAAFGGAISEVQKAADKAKTDLDDWSNNRAKEFSIERGTRLQRAQNEVIQKRIPKLVEDEQSQLKTHCEAVLKEWTTKRDSTTCGLQCEVRPKLDEYRQSIHDQGPAAIGRAVRQANTQLEQQTRDGRQMLGQMRTSAHAQIQAHQRAARSRLNGAARQMLSGVRQETQAAIDGVQAAGRSALQGYPRTAQRLQETFQRAAEGGPAALARAAGQAPADVMRNVETVHSQQIARVTGNAERLRLSLIAHGDTFERGHQDQLAQATETLVAANQATTDQLLRTNAGYREAFGTFGRVIQQAAQAWSTPIEKHFAEYLAQARGNAAASLQSVLNGTPRAPGSGGGGGAPGGPGAGTAAAHAPGTPGCTCPEEAPAGAGTGAATGGGAAREGAGGLLGQKQRELDFFEARAKPADVPGLSSQLESIRTDVRTKLAGKARDVAKGFEAGIIFKVSESQVTGALHGLTPVSGPAVEQLYSEIYHTSLEFELVQKLSGDDLTAALSFLHGNAIEGARAELRASLGIFNDDEARIHETMRSLSPDQLKALGAADPALITRVHDALDGTDQQVFDALTVADYARADAILLRDKVDEARRKGDDDAVHAAIVESTSATDKGWGGDEITAEQRRTQVIQALGKLVSESDGKPIPAGDKDKAAQEATDRAVAYVTRPVEVVVAYGDQAQIETREITKANLHLAVALMRQGEGSTEARVARLGVEAQRTGDKPNVLNVDKAMYDERFRPSAPNASPEQKAQDDIDRAKAHAERDKILLKFVETYGDEGKKLPEGATSEQIREAAAAKLRPGFGDDTLGADLTTGLIKDDRPTAKTATLAMRHATERVGTDEQLLFRITERMDRREIQAMRDEYLIQTGHTLDSELGTFGQGGFFTELSGDDRLRMERALLGTPRTDRERFEVAAFTMEQQKKETGSFGKWLAGGSRAEMALDDNLQRLKSAAGPDLVFNDRGELLAGGNFDAKGNYTGKNREIFFSSAAAADQVAQNYSARIDAYANFATTGIAIVGAVVGAVIGVLTGGAALPLVAAAIAFGLASMAANYAIKGGRYGWEQGAIDLGMTAVQALTAGIGAQLGAAARTASTAIRTAETAATTAVTTARTSLTGLARLFTGNPVVDQMIIGAVTGGVSGAGQTALSEQTWERGIGRGFEALLEGSLRGAAGGAAASAVTSRIDAIGTKAGTIGERMQHLSAEGGFTRGFSAMMRRGVGRAAISSLGGMASRGTEIGFDVLTGHFHGDAGDALVSIGEAGAHSALQGIAEGAAESHAQRIVNRREGARAAAAAAHEPVAARPTAAEPVEAAAPRATTVAEPTEAIQPPPRPVAAEPVEAPSSRRPVAPVEPAEPAAAAPRPVTPAEPAVVRRAVAQPTEPTLPTPRPTAAERAEPAAASRQPLVEPAEAVQQPPAPRPATAEPAQPTPLRAPRPEAAEPGAAPRARPAGAETPEPTGAATTRRPVTAEPTEETQRRPATTEPTEQTRRRPAATEPTEATATRRLAATEPTEETQRRPVTTEPTEEAQRRAARETESGTAAGVRESDFHGNVLTRNREGHFGSQGASGNQINLALGRLMSTEIETPTVRVKTSSGEEVTVNVRLAKDPLPAGADGLSPVARFNRVSDTHYQIEVSPAALGRHVERALAHELTEIRMGHTVAEPAQPGAAAGPKPTERADVLAPGGDPRPIRQGEVPELSPHDHGRLAELGVIARQLREETHPGKKVQLQDDAERLVAALGLTGPSGAAERRRAIAQAVLETDSESAHVLGLLREAADQAKLNPFLLRASGDPAADLKSVSDVLKRIDSIQDPTVKKQWTDELLKHTAQVLVDANTVRTARNGTMSREMGAMAGLLRMSPEEFISSNDRLARFVHEASGEHARGLGRSDARPPSPGFEAEYIDAHGRPATKSQAMVSHAEMTPTGSHVDRRLGVLQARMRQETALELELKAPTTPTSRPKVEIEADLRLVRNRINQHAERLGEAAGREFARRQPGSLKELDIGRTGAGVPDLLFESSSGRLVVVECKGGESKLGTRLSADGRYNVQQGTIEYLDSLARSMGDSSSPQIRALGERMRIELAKTPPNVDYHLVEQPYRESGPLPPPRVAKFDMAPNQAR